MKANKSRIKRNTANGRKMTSTASTKISEVRKDLLGVISEFCGLTTQFSLLRVNKKFNEVIKKNTLFIVFIEERKNLPNFSNAKQLFDEDYADYDSDSDSHSDFDSSYLTTLVNTLNLKFKYSSQFENCFTEIMNIHFKQVAVDRKLDLSGCSIGYFSKKIEYTSMALKHNENIIKLNLTNTHLTYDPENIKVLFTALKNNKNIKSINLGSNFLGNYPESLKYLSEFLQDNHNITELDLNSNLLGRNRQSIIYYSEALKQSNSITTLNLGSNSLGENPESMNKLFLILKDNKTIKSLDLSCNSLHILDRKSVV